LGRDGITAQARHAQIMQARRAANPDGHSFQRVSRNADAIIKRDVNRAARDARIIDARGEQRLRHADLEIPLRLVAISA